MYKCIHTHLHTHTHTEAQRHTYTHTHTHIHTHSSILSGRGRFGMADTYAGACTHTIVHMHTHTHTHTHTSILLLEEGLIWKTGHMRKSVFMLWSIFGFLHSDFCIFLFYYCEMSDTLGLVFIIYLFCCLWLVCLCETG